MKKILVCGFLVLLAVLVLSPSPARAQDPHIPVVPNPVFFVCFNFGGFPVCFTNNGFGFVAFQSTFAANNDFSAGQIVFDPIVGGFFGGLFGFSFFGPIPALTPIPEEDVAIWFVNPFFADFDVAFWPIIGRDQNTGSFSARVGVALMINF